MFDIFYHNNDPVSAKGLCQKVDIVTHPKSTRFHSFTTEEMDEVSSLPFMRDVHLYHKKDGAISYLETIKFSISTHQGCYGNVVSVPLCASRTHHKKP